MALLYAQVGWPVIPLHSVEAGRCTCGRDDCGSPGKHPRTINGLRAGTLDRDQIIEWWSRYPQANIGVITGQESGIVVLDCDAGKGGLDTLAELEREYGQLQTKFAITGGGGRHYVFRHPGGRIGNRSGILPGLDIRGDGGYIVAPPSNHASGNQYIWDRQYKISSIPDWLLAIMRNGHPKPDSQGPSFNFCLEQGSRDESLFHLANTLRRGGMSYENALLVVKLAARACNPPFPESEAVKKVDSAYKRNDDYQENISSAVREWLNINQGVFTIDDVAKDILQNHDRNARKYLSVVLQHLSETGLIVKHGSKRGVYRIVDDQANDINFLAADISKPYPIKWPFRIEDMVNIYPKNIVVLAGATNAGKTAFLLNLARMNMYHLPVRYFSSEMGPEEVRLRLGKFDIPIEEFARHLQVRERASNFADVVDPEALNIIDFLEIYDRFYAIGEEIRAIYDKLTTGVAVIAIQKARGSNWGRGGDFSAEKARLYLSMEYGKLTITKAKNWARRNFNPNGKYIEFNIVDGHKLVPRTDWQGV